MDISMHTPGPWRIGDGGKTVFGPKTDQPSPVMVASLPPATPRVSAEERRDNARLIAAAPEMLAVLIQAVESTGWSLSGLTDVRAAENGEPAWVCNARATIAKAKGLA